MNCVACGASLSGSTPFLAAAWSSADSGAGKWSLSSKGRRTPPSRERETWILVSLVMREIETVRRGKAIVSTFRCQLRESRLCQVAIVRYIRLQADQNCNDSAG